MNSELLKLVNGVSGDPGLVQRLKEASSAAAITEIFNEAGLEVDLEKLFSMPNPGPSMEITDQDLEGFTGALTGKTCTVRPCRCIDFVEELYAETGE